MAETKRTLSIAEDDDSHVVVRLEPEIEFQYGSQHYTARKLRINREDVYRLCPDLEKGKELGKGDLFTYDVNAVVVFARERINLKHKRRARKPMDSSDNVMGARLTELDEDDILKELKSSDAED